MTQALAPEPCLQSLRDCRGSLVDKLEFHIDSLIDVLTTKKIFTRDDREEIQYEKGPRGKVRKVLDILEGKGEEAARIFISTSNHFETSKVKAGDESNQSLNQTTEYQKVQVRHKEVLKRRSECMLYSNTRHGEKIPFSEHYVNLLIVKGHHSLEFKRHEVLTFGQQRISLQQKTTEQRLIKPAQLFTSETGKKSAKKILVTGVAGIGKTVLVQKILCDFSNYKEHQSFDFIIHLTFRDLNLVNKPVSLRELILRKNGHLAKHLDTITKNDAKLLIILDGFDEFKHYRGCDVDSFLTDLDEVGEVMEVFSSLMISELLPGASVLVTSRPTAVSHIPVGFIDCFVVITGFSTVEIRDFFQRFFQDEKLATKMFEIVAANDLMLTLCYIPAFCHIMCSILKESKRLCTANPRTMTDIYVQYLLALVKSHTNSDISMKHQQHLEKILLNLGRLAYQKLMNQETLFYSNSDDIANCVIASAFLDKTSIQEPGCTEDVYSFTHLTIQEFFAALYCAMEDIPLSDTLGSGDEYSIKSLPGNLDLFTRFLSGLLSVRNQELLHRNIGFQKQKEKMQSFQLKLISDTQDTCENGAYILTHLHCILEQQDILLLQKLKLQCLRFNLSDVTLSSIDYNAVKYFLDDISLTILEVDLTGTNINVDSLRDLQPYLLRCERIWLGENSLDLEAIQIVADIIRESDILKELGLEGNRLTIAGLSLLIALTPSPLETVVAIWNHVTDEEGQRLNDLCPKPCFTVSFTENRMWKEWASWVLQRCEEPSEKKQESEKKKRSRVKQLLADVKRQVEFWFGDVNLHKDRYLKNVLMQSRDGYVDICLLTTFNKMKKLTTDTKLIARALKNSEVLEELLPKDVTHVWIERVFSKCGSVVYISIPRYKSTGDSKGFAFVEFKTQSQAQKAIEMLNNPPEDAPRKAGIFPKTLARKPIPFHTVQDDAKDENEFKGDDDEDGKKKKKKKKRARSEQKEDAVEEMATEEVANEDPAAETVESKEKRAQSLKSAETDSITAGKNSQKKADRKRLRSQSSELSGGEGQVDKPAKIRKVDEEERDIKETSSENNTEKELEDGKKDEKDDSISKAKRKRKKKYKERLKIEEEVIPLRVLSKKEWLDLKEEYLSLQKQCMASLKKNICDIQKTISCDSLQTMEESGKIWSDCKPEKETIGGPKFETGVILKITHSQPLPNKKSVKDTLSEIASVQYVDIVEGDSEGYIRFKSPEDAKAVITVRVELQKKHNWNLDILTGDHEQRYWQKILVDRQAKLNRPRDKKRGTEKNVVIRVAKLPLVSSTYGMVSDLYSNTKDNHPAIKSMCEVAEIGVKTITSAALTSALPIIGKLEPQISRANDLACKSLDKIEKTLPILHQPSGQLVSSAKDRVTGTMNGAKETMSTTLSHVMVRTRGVVQESVEKTRIIVTGGVNTVMESKMAKLVSSSVDSALSTSEVLIDRYLPAPEDNQEQEINITKGFETETNEPNYYVRLGSISSKLRQRAYQKAISKVYDAKTNSQESITQLNRTMDLIEYTRKNINGANQKVVEKLSALVDWNAALKNDGDTDNKAEIIESQTLTIARNLTQQLQTTCLTLVSNLQGLPQNIQEQTLSIGQMAVDVYARFNSAVALSDLSDTVLVSTRVQLKHMRESINNVMDYLVNNTPLNWLVGPFYPRTEMSEKPRSQSSDDSSNPPEVEMQPLAQ
ncbi:La-related protein 7 [Bagarius yarrelli]|uniref:La-related protein 7 n=1 Tax=Bagarius yarrelli TaxID=175774 RepID=A0A556TVC2_BAGYA|nr:La-related protein 7 [Bagarius yarrelli]